MNYIILSIIFFYNLLIYNQSCPPQDTLAIIPVQNQWNIPQQGSWNELEVITWNLREFPYSDYETINNIQEVISDLKPDIIAFQEINDLNAFANLEELLPAYGFFSTNYWGDFGLNLAFAYRRDCLTLEYSTTLFSSEGYNFAYRYPLLGSFIWNCGENYIDFKIINVHFKAYTDDESFQRRYESSEIISNYVNEQSNVGNDKIIILGDFNDEMNDPQNNNSLWPMVVNSQLNFVTENLVYNNYYDSYILSGGYFIDHIIVSEGLFTYLETDYSTTIRIDDYTGFNQYTSEISDHRPVMWKILVESEEFINGLIINEIMNNPQSVNDDYGEWIEILNVGNTPINLNNYIIKDNDIDFHIIISSIDIIVNPGDYFLMGKNMDFNLNGGINIQYQYTDFYLSNSYDEIILQHPSGIIADEVWYDNGITFPDPNGKSMALTDYLLDNSLGSNWVESELLMDNGDYGSPGQDNFNCIEIIWYADFDYDGLGDPNYYILDCNQPDNFVNNNYDLEPECSTNDTDYCGICGGNGSDGDVNNDGIVNIIDVVLLVNYILDTVEFSNLSACKGDINLDSIINIVDIVIIVNSILAN